MFHVYSKRASKIVPKIYILFLQRLGFFFLFFTEEIYFKLNFFSLSGIGTGMVRKVSYFFPDEADIKK